jgi:hypothetical protein
MAFFMAFSSALVAVDCYCRLYSGFSSEQKLTVRPCRQRFSLFDVNAFSKIELVGFSCHMLAVVTRTTSA